MVRFRGERHFHHIVIKPGQERALGPEIDSLFDHGNAAGAARRAQQTRGTARRLKEGDIYRKDGLLLTHGANDGPAGPADHLH